MLIDPIVHDTNPLAWKLLALIEEEADLRSACFLTISFIYSDTLGVFC